MPPNQTLSLSELRTAATAIAEALPRVARSFALLRKCIPSQSNYLLDVSLIGKPEMQRWNRKFRGKNKPTDVLSIELPKSFRSIGQLGAILICTPILRAQARTHQHPVLEELQILIVHGFLHCLGFDHESSIKKAAEMAKWETKLLSKLSKINAQQSPHKRKQTSSVGLIDRAFGDNKKRNKDKP